MNDLIVVGWGITLILIALLLGRIEKAEEEIRALKTRRVNE